jgi:hypothetical protein
MVFGGLVPAFTATKARRLSLQRRAKAQIYQAYGFKKKSRMVFYAC